MFYYGVKLMDNKKLTVKEIHTILQGNNLPNEQIKILEADTRVAVIRLFQKWKKEQVELARVQKLYCNEYEFHRKGHRLIAGVDEAGRGPLAGPVVVAAVILPLGLHIPKINDSKKLSAKAREEVYDIVIANAIAVECVVIDVTTIDCINIYQATVQGMYSVIDALTPFPEAVFIDAVPLKQLKIPALSLIKGDAISATIAAASIVAKVERDRIMDELDQKYPVYGFTKHKGYGTTEHMKALREFGPCPIHRKSFEPIKSWRK